MSYRQWQNQQVTVRGEVYQIKSISEDKGHRGSKFAGKHVFTLRKIEDGSMWRYFGKAVTANAKLTAED